MISKNQFGIIFILTIFSFLWYVYLEFIKTKNPNEEYLFGKCLFNYSIHPPIINRFWKLDFERCFDIWSLVHFFIYLITGSLFPGELILIFILSLKCEILEILMKSRGRISDIFFNIFGYLVGCYISKFIKIKIDFDNYYTYFIIPSFLFTLFIFYKIYIKRKKELKKIKLPSWKE